MRNLMLFLAASALVVAANGAKSFATGACNMSGCTKVTVRVKTLSALTCNGADSSCDCMYIAQHNGDGTASCVAGNSQVCLSGDDWGFCNSGPPYHCCGWPSGMKAPVEEEQVSEAPADDMTQDISAAMAGEKGPVHVLSSYWGYYNSTLKSPSTGTARDCTAKIHVCFVHGFSDLTGVTDQNSCNNACNSATNTNQAECYDTDCSSRCTGWWGASDTCS